MSVVADLKEEPIIGLTLGGLEFIIYLFVFLPFCGAAGTKNTKYPRQGLRIGLRG